jgi:hypothetical protein
MTDTTIDTVRRPSRRLARGFLFVGAVVVLWLLAPATASADDDPAGLAGLADSVLGTTPETVDATAEVVDSVTGSATDGAVEAVDEVVEVVDQTAEGAVEAATGTADQLLETTTSTVTGTLETLANGLEGVNGAAGGVVQETVEALDGGAGETPGIESPVEVPDPGTGPAWNAPPPPTGRAITGSDSPLAVAGSGSAALAGAAPAPDDGGLPASSGAPERDRTGSTTVPTATSGGDASMARTQGGGRPARDAAVLATMLLIVLVLARWSRREVGRRPTLVFLSLAERPG